MRKIIKFTIFGMILSTSFSVIGIAKDNPNYILITLVVLIIGFAILVYQFLDYSN